MEVYFSYVSISRPGLCNLIFEFDKLRGLLIYDEFSNFIYMEELGRHRVSNTSTLS